MYTKLSAVLWCGLAVLSGIAAAQPVLNYDSAYADYKAYREEPLAKWRDVNDETARIGGHAGIFGGSAHRGLERRDALQPRSGAPAPEKQSVPAASAHGHGHR